MKLLYIFLIIFSLYFLFCLLYKNKEPYDTQSNNVADNAMDGLIPMNTLDTVKNLTDTQILNATTGSKIEDNDLETDGSNYDPGPDCKAMKLYGEECAKRTHIHKYKYESPIQNTIDLIIDKTQ